MTLKWRRFSLNRRVAVSSSVYVCKAKPNIPVSSRKIGEQWVMDITQLLTTV